MTTHTELCERLRLAATSWHPACDEAADFIESQAKQIAELSAKVQQQALEYTSLFDQCSDALAKVAELQAQLERSGRAVIFAGLVLNEHRNDGCPGDIDGDVLHDYALEAGMIEERTVTEPCGPRCECQTTGVGFPLTCCFNTDAGKAAIAAADAAEKEQG